MPPCVNQQQSDFSFNFKLSFNPETIFFPPYISEECKFLIKSLLQPNEILRYDLRKIVKDPFFLKHFEVYKSSKIFQEPKRKIYLQKPTNFENFETQQKNIQSSTSNLNSNSQIPKLGPSPNDQTFPERLNHNKKISPSFDQNPTTTQSTPNYDENITFPPPSANISLNSSFGAREALNVLDLELQKLHESEYKAKERKSKLQKDIFEKLSK